jgi:hypothetical protein
MHFGVAEYHILCSHHCQIYITLSEQRNFLGELASVLEVLPDGIGRAHEAPAGIIRFPKKEVLPKLYELFLYDWLIVLSGDLQEHRIHAICSLSILTQMS